MISCFLPHPRIFVSSTRIDRPPLRPPPRLRSHRRPRRPRRRILLRLLVLWLYASLFLRQSPRRLPRHRDCSSANTTSQLRFLPLLRRPHPRRPHRRRPSLHHLLRSLIIKNFTFRSMEKNFNLYIFFY